jgi:hypothetical protein
MNKNGDGAQLLEHLSMHEKGTRFNSRISNCYFLLIHFPRSNKI